jgi:acyl-CoA hydrolase
VIELATVNQLEWGRYLRAGDGILWGQACAEPRTLVEHLVSHAEIEGLTAFVGIPLTGTIQPLHTGALRYVSYTGAGANAALHDAGALDVLPAHYSRFPELIASGAIKVDVAIVQLSPPDSAGRYRLGMAVDYLLAALRSARLVIGEVNPLVPRTFGDTTVTAEQVDVVVPSRYAPAENRTLKPSAAQDAVATNVASLIEDGATLQFGVGALSEAVLAKLTDRRDLGVHSGMLPDALVDLMESGVVTGAHKSVDRGIAVGGMLLGTRKLFDFADGNERIQLRGTEYTHNAGVLAAQHKFVALNSAVEVVLTGQVHAEVARGHYIGSVGGSVDFLRGAANSRGGLPIVMLPARARSASRIVMHLSGPVTTARSDACIVVTEYGVADLRGLTLSQRAERLISIAAPDMRAVLDARVDRILAQKGPRPT